VEGPETRYSARGCSVAARVSYRSEDERQGISAAARGRPEYSSGRQKKQSSTPPVAPAGRSVFMSCPPAATKSFGTGGSKPARAANTGSGPNTLRPNPSLEPTRSGMAPWPPSAEYHAALVGQGAMPPRSAHLKRYEATSDFCVSQPLRRGHGPRRHGCELCSLSSRFGQVSLSASPARSQSVRSTCHRRRERELDHRAPSRTRRCNNAPNMFLSKCKAFCLTGRSSGPPPAGRATLAVHFPLHAANRRRPLS
jgi:hypothetical protein